MQFIQLSTPPRAPQMRKADAKFFPDDVRLRVYNVSITHAIQGEIHPAELVNLGPGSAPISMTTSAKEMRSMPVNVSEPSSPSTILMSVTVDMQSPSRLTFAARPLPVGKSVRARYQLPSALNMPFACPREWHSTRLHYSRSALLPGQNVRNSHDLKSHRVQRNSASSRARRVVLRGRRQSRLRSPPF